MTKSFSSTVIHSVKSIDASYDRLSQDSQDLIFKHTEFDEAGIWVTIKFNGKDSIHHCHPDEHSSVDLCAWSEHQYDESLFSDILYNANLSNRESHFGTFCLNQGTGCIELHYSVLHEVMDLVDFGGIIIELLYRYSTEVDMINPNSDRDTYEEEDGNNDVVAE
jgi:hypothetical protein